MHYVIICKDILEMGHVLIKNRTLLTQKKIDLCMDMTFKGKKMCNKAAEI
jgi:hypoxanthine-guanine phosphoribosyltransferase